VKKQKECLFFNFVPPPEAEVEGLPGPPEPPGIFGYPVGGKGRGKSMSKLQELT